MKKSNTIKRDYSESDSTTLEYYGVLIKNGKARIDTKRYKKFFTLPNSKIEHRQSVYYLPTKVHRDEYICNTFRNTISEISRQWHQEFSKAIKAIKTPEQVEGESRITNIADGVLECEEVDVISTIAKVKRITPYKFVIKSIYIQFFHQLMAQIDALCLRVCVSQGYSEKDFTKKAFDIFIQGKQKANSISFLAFNNYSVYDKAYTTWNFLKHNSTRAYEELKKKYPEMIYDPNNNYKNGDLAIGYVKIDEKYIIKCLTELPLFFDEVCRRGFDENTEDAAWDYDDYFIKEAKREIDLILNPLDI